VDRDKIVELLQRFRVFPKVRVDGCTQKGSLDEPWILPERFIAMRNGELVLPVPCKNLRALLEGGPEFWISVQSRVHVALRTGTSPFYSCFSALLLRFIAARRPAPPETMIGTLACAAARLTISAMRRAITFFGHNLVGLVARFVIENPATWQCKVRLLSSRHRQLKLCEV
jgi:hypothetical protein